MKDRRKLIAIVCGTIVLFGMLISGGRLAFRLNQSLNMAGMTAKVPKMPEIPEIPEIPDVGDMNTLAIYGMKPRVNGIDVDMTAKDADNRDLDPYHTLQVDVNDASIKLIPSDRYGIKYCYYTDLRKVFLENKDGVLTFGDQYNEKYINGKYGISMSGSWNVPDNFVEIYYPKGASFHSVTLNNFYGDAKLSELEAESVTLNLHSGDGSLSNLYAKKLNIVCEYGDLCIENQKAFASDSIVLQLHSGDLSVTRLSSTGEMDISADYGQVALEKIEAPALQIIAHSGDVTAIDVNGGKMNILADYGDVRLQRLLASQLSIDCSSGEVIVQGDPGNQTKINADYGDVTLEFSGPKASYHYKLSTDYGVLCVDGKTARADDGEDAEHLEENAGAPNIVQVECSSGDVDLIFHK